MFFGAKNRESKGFTLVELLVVISMLGALTSITLVNVKDARAKARDASRISDMKQIIGAMELYRDKYGYLPGRGGSCDTGGEGYHLGEGESCIDNELSDFIDTPADPLVGEPGFYYAYDPVHCDSDAKCPIGGATLGFNRSETDIEERETTCGGDENLDNADWNKMICHLNSTGSACDTCSSLGMDC